MDQMPIRGNEPGPDSPSPERVGVFMMADAKTIKKKMQEQVRKEQAKGRRLPADKLKEQLLNWLAEIRIPTGTAADSWEDLIQEFPTNKDEVPESGLELRLAIRLATRENRYLITVMECMSLDSRGIGIVSTHINWKPNERRIQATVEKTYTGEFDDILRAKHTLWAQSFKIEDFMAALCNCAIAILSMELTVAPDDPLKVESIPWCQPQAMHVPKPIDEEM